jgi:hypothetical protein
MTRAPAQDRGTAPFAAAALAAVALLADVAFDPAHRHVPLCPFHATTGWWCPLCGGLRAADALAHLDLRAARHDNLLLVLALPVVVAWWVGWVARARAGRPRRGLPAGGIVAVVALGVAFTVVRNLPFATALRPG